ncbi:Transcription factor like [Actinidia chinensis var. chinensis]|uniref:Transcription factor like n=1 Tax=Actinidia chinensis var. chinensis TaxID=1590841 RepID=A0A2R6PLL6_ACTCC|nr:Transcription factor like [Actinidia chinensis var. chinensis]
MACKSDLDSKVLEPLRESDWGQKKSGIPEAPTNLLDDGKTVLPKDGLAFQFPGGVDLSTIIFSFVFDNLNQGPPELYETSGHKYNGEWPEEGTWDQCQAADLNTEYTLFQSRGYHPWSMPIEGVTEDRAASSSKSHSQAEKRRRDRINAQLATLRKLIPKSDKMDKAALLGSVVEHVKDLKRKALEASKAVTVPTEVDEVTIDYFYLDQDKKNIFIKASVCCDDRPELFSELTQALRSLNLTTVRADMASLGGRIKSILVMCAKDGKEGVCVNSVVQSLKGVLSRIASSSTASSYRMRSKRQRFFLPSH